MAVTPRFAAARMAVLAAVVTVAACSAGARRDASSIALDPCAAPGTDTAGWTVVDAGQFGFSVPPGYARREVQGIDSYVGEWRGPGRRFVHFDWGHWSSTLDEAERMLHGYQECAAGIGGHRAKVVAGYDTAGTWGGPGRKYVVAATWRDVHPDTHLTLFAAGPDSADLPALLSIVRSVRFEP
ncbi:MAG TPA: hypothetical protein VHG08_29140 [Longimicrobium sp.]|nr:hypothetical protein [Longimicrobium sp.]